MCKRLLCSLSLLLLLCLRGYAQSDAQNFRNFQMSSSRVADALRRYDDTLKNAFKKKGLIWPARDIYIRIFKSQNEMELWGRNNETSEYKLVKTYKVCAISGQLGPKREQGDKQVPEGYYFIDDFNPKSDYLLSLLINYPNYSDELQGKQKKGGNIYIHGGCVTVGCVPMTDEGIKEIYAVCLNAKLSGQEFIPVHIYPTRMSKAGINYLISEYAGKTEKQQFWAVLKNGFDYFEKNHKLLPVMYAPDGTYVN